MKKTILFDFNGMTKGDAPLKLVKRYFQKAGAAVIEISVNQKPKRSSGVTYREVSLAFADSQTVVLRVKQTGDIFEVLLNGSAIPIKNQDNHVDAVAEIVNAMDGKRSAFQKKLAATAAAIPPGIKTAAPTMRRTLEQRRDALKDAIAAVREEIATYQQPQTSRA